jgi:hypothetical protein
MDIQANIKLPDELVGLDSEKLSREVFEQVVAEGYKDGQLSLKQVRILLGFSSRFEAEDFIHRRKATGYTMEVLRKELKTMEDLGLQ